MKIMKVVYTKECSTSDWDGSNGRSYMGENSWSIGENSMVSLSRAQLQKSWVSELLGYK